MQKDKKSGSSIKRHITGVLLLPVLIAYIYFLEPLPYFLVLLGAVAAAAMWEFYEMYRVPARLYIPGIMIGILLFYIFCRYPAYIKEGILISMLLLLMLRLFFATTPAGCMAEIAPVTMGFFYIVFLLSFQWLLRIGDYGLEYIFLLYIATWLSDSMAYYIGTYLGRNKLYPAVSPNKTIEGAFGSVIGGILGVVIIKNIFDMTALSVTSVIAIGTALGISALVGDLIESMFKRDAGVKDSSNLIPGHGGILDKIDGFLVTGPVLYFIVRYF